ncbi:rhomboid family intramembrane serine protease [Acidobacteriota bacterium]
MSDDNRYEWIERVVKFGRAFGLNPVRVRWKLRAWQDRLNDSLAALSTRKKTVTRRHKTCPSCRSLNDSQTKVCAECGASLHSRPVEIAGRVVRHFDVGFSPESFLSLAFVITYATVALRGLTSNWLTFSPQDLIDMGGNFFPFTISGQWWRLWTSVFLHAGIFHIGFNTYALLYIMPFIREVYGSSRALVVFCVTGVCASTVSLATGMAMGVRPVSIGASGAICGLIGLAIIWAHRLGTSRGIALRNVMVRWVIYIFIFGFFVGADNAAHLGGIASGALSALIIQPRGSRPETKLFSFLGIIASVSVVVAVALVVILGFTQAGQPEAWPR